MGINEAVMEAIKSAVSKTTRNLPFYLALNKVIAIDDLNEVEKWLEEEKEGNAVFAISRYDELVSLVDHYRVLLELMAKKDEIFNAEFVKKFPMISAKLAEGEAMKCFLDCSLFCSARPDLVAEVVEPIMKKRIEEKVNRFSMPIPPRADRFTQNLDWAVRAKITDFLSSFTQYQIQIFLDTFLPGIKTRGGRTGPNEYFFEWGESQSTDS